MSAGRPDEWDDERRTRRAGSRYDDREDYDDAREYGGTREAALAKVGPPAVCLVVVSLLSLVIALIGAVAGMVMFQNPGPGKTEEDGVIVAVVCALYIPYSAVMLAGAVRMKALRGYGLAMTAAIMAVANIACFGVCGLLSVGFGIWALVAMQDANVKRQFRRTRGPARDYDDEY